MGSPKIALKLALVLKGERHLKNSLDMVQHSKKQRGIVSDPDLLVADLTVSSYVLSSWRSEGWISTAAILLYPIP